MSHVSVTVHTCSPKSSYSVFLFLNVFYAAKTLLSCYKDKLTDNNKEKLTFILTVINITSHKITYCSVTATPHERKKSSHCFCTCSCGSLIVELALEFASIVSETLVVNTLQTAATNDSFGEFAVNASSIQGIAVIESTSTPPTGTPTGGTSDGMVSLKMYSFLHVFSVIKS